MRLAADYLAKEVVERLVAFLVIGFIVWVGIIYLQKPFQPWLSLAFSGGRGMVPTLALLGCWEILGFIGWRVILSYRWLWE